MKKNSPLSAAKAEIEGLLAQARAWEAVARLLFSNVHCEGRTGQQQAINTIKWLYKVKEERDQLLAEREERGKQEPVPAVPEGWQLVPKEPTEVMIDAGRWEEYGESSCGMYSVEDDTVIDTYKDMLATAPQYEKVE